MAPSRLRSASLATAVRASLGAARAHGYDAVLDISETFSDAERLLAECEKRGLEGIVSKRKDAQYRSGKCDWVKVKTRVWRNANKDRGELFNPRKPSP